MADTFFDLRPRLNDTQIMLRDSAKAACAEIKGTSRPRAINLGEAWRRFAEFGWTGVVIPEEFSGSAGSLLDAGVISLELGRSGMFVCYPETVALSFALSKSLDFLKNPGRTLLEEVAAGKTGLLFSQNLDPEGPDEPADQPRDVISANGPEAGYLLRLTEGHTPQLVAFPLERLRLRPLRTIRRGREFLLLDEPAPEEGILLVEGDRAAHAWAIADTAFRCLTSAMLIGNGRAILDMAIEYAKMRAQFGHVIANYQVVQHALVDIFAALEGSEVMVIKTLDILDAEGWSHGLVRASTTYSREAVWNALMKTYDVFGGVAFMEEHPLSDFTRGMVPLISSLGRAEECFESVAETVRKGAFLA